MSKQVLDIEQMEHLQKLGLDTSNASMCWIKDTEGNQHLSVHDEYCYEASFMNPIPAYTLQDVLDILPTEIKPAERRFWLRIDLSDECLYYYYDDCNLVECRKKVIGYDGIEELIDAAYSMLCWAIENEYIKTNLED